MYPLAGNRTTPPSSTGRPFTTCVVQRVALRECIGEQHQGSFSSGRVEILSVDDECVVGRLIDTADALEESGASIEGGFVALRCTPGG